MQQPSSQLVDTLRQELRQTIQRHLWQRGWKKTHLAEAAGLHLSELSTLMNPRGKRTFPIHIVDAITEALKLPTGTLYPYYLGECFNNTKLVKHRFEEFLFQCSMLHLTELVEQILDILMQDSANHLDVIFTVAKRLFDEKRLDEALPLINIVVTHDPNRQDRKSVV